MPRTGRKIVITEATSGFGASDVRAFADRGAHILGTMRDAEGRNAGKKAALEAYSPASPSPRCTPSLSQDAGALPKGMQPNSVPGGADTCQACP